MQTATSEPAERFERMQLKVLAARWEAEGITSYEFVHPDGAPLPLWTPGAHVDVHLPSGLVRQYSLCGETTDRDKYRVAVLELPNGRGGSREAHRELRPGAVVTVGVPRSNFELRESPRYLFVAGGIGITPLLPMIREVQKRGAPWELVYGARSQKHFAFIDELRAMDSGHIKFIAQDMDGHPDLAELVNRAKYADVYCCGPAALMDALSSAMERTGRLGSLHLERFSPTSRTASAAESHDNFEVELARSQLVVSVPSEMTILEAIRAVGVDHPSSCEMGICGTCETNVLSGEVDHRDSILTEGEKTAGSTMMICVSRARCPKLVLDI